MDGTGSGTCPVAEFIVRGVNLIESSVTVVLLTRATTGSTWYSAVYNSNTCKNINNPHLAIWDTQLRGYVHRINAEQVSILTL